MKEQWKLEPELVNAEKPRKLKEPIGLIGWLIINVVLVGLGICWLRISMGDRYSETIFWRFVVVFLVGNLIVSGTKYFQRKRERYLVQYGDPVPGTIRAIKMGYWPKTRYTLSYRYQNMDYQSTVVEYDLASFQNDQLVTLLIDPENPTSATIYGLSYLVSAR